MAQTSVPETNDNFRTICVAIHTHSHFLHYSITGFVRKFWEYIPFITMVCDLETAFDTN